MGCREDSVDSDLLYWSSRGINPETRRYTCCGVEAYDTLEGAKPHLWSCRRLAQIRAGKTPTV